MCEKCEIKSEEEYDKILKEIEELFDSNDPRLNELVDLVCEYEDRHYPIMEKENE